ncbi:hypothetical protein FBZ89_12175 [Nitrospirillum amazonense]|uniref:L,D-transpeptidase-like protein n=1 Tax=Nitrospirillum amazonense TaxID=28077 RepID=A0A560EUU8_9PROT|nr:L,D-transpeptidase [Nitrospirillum amazonense]TWB13108.1 hypothetical protein FBZ89_12175 [Nitrospirillum amazonense]
MSKLQFDGVKHQIALINASGSAVGTWAAYNNVDSHATIRHIHNGIYTIQDRIRPHHHTASADGPYGLHGIIRFDVPGHPGIGVHSGRAHARHLPGPEHPTMGCIRTSDEAMAAICGVMIRDPLATIEVFNNDASAARIASIVNHHQSLQGRAYA